MEPEIEANRSKGSIHIHPARNKEENNPKILNCNDRLQLDNEICVKVSPSVSSYIPTFDQDNISKQKTSVQSIQERNQADRKGFIRKVYSILTIQLIFTIILISIVVAVPSVKSGVQSVYPLFYTSLAITILLIIGILCFKNLAKKYPYNYIALTIFTLFESYIVAFICSYYNSFTVLAALILAFAVALALTIYAFRAKSDPTVCNGIMISIISSLFVFGIFIIFFYNNYVQMIICEIIIIIYSIFIVYDTQLIAGGRYPEISYDDYIIAALILYVDIIGLFIYILSFLGAKN